MAAALLVIVQPVVSLDICKTSTLAKVFQAQVDV